MKFDAYESAKHGAALADVSAWGKLAFRGPDRKKSLHGLLTNDIQGLGPWQGLATCILTPKGKLIADLALYDVGDELMSVQLPQATAGILAGVFKPLMLTQTLVEDVSRSWAAFLILGPKTPRILKEILRTQPLKEYACARVEWGGESLIAFSYPVLAPEETLMLIPAESAKNFESNLLEQGRSCGLRPAEPAVMEILRVEAGVPTLGVDTDDDTLPLELPLEHAISFTKGCYLGQETTARIKNFGHVNRKLVGIKLTEPASPQAAVFFGGERIGRITSIVESPRLGTFLALGTIRYEHSEAGTQVVVKENGREFVAEVTALPVT